MDRTDETKTAWTVAIDGPAGAGKSTVARKVAQRLGYTYIDTGAMYRAVTWAVLQAGLAPGDEDAVARRAADTEIQLQTDAAGVRVVVAGQDVTDVIRGPETSAAVSYVAANPKVREHLVALQRRMARQGGVVMDGRDIGTVVLPDADVKVFLTASAEERARRRFEELKTAGHAESLEAIRRNIEQRDAIDSGRSVAPLRKAKDAVEIDTTDRTIDEVVGAVLRLVRTKEGSRCTP